MEEEDMSCSVTERVPEKSTEAEGQKLRRSSSTTSVTTPSKSKPEVSDTAVVESVGNVSSSASKNLRERVIALGFFWCCCCCNWCCGTTPRRVKGENGSVHSEEDIPPPSLSEIRSWGCSFDKLMTSEAGRKVFFEFLCCEYSDENIRFWLACEELKKLTEKDKIEDRARQIYEDFISILSASEVSLDSRVREIINRNMMEPSIHTFDEAQLQIYTLMHRDSYPRFVNSKMYKKLANLDAVAAPAPAETETETETEPAAAAAEGTDESCAAPTEPHG